MHYEESPVRFACINKRYILRVAVTTYTIILALLLIHFVLVVQIGNEVLLELDKLQNDSDWSANNERLAPANQRPSSPADFSLPIKALLSPDIVNCTDVQLVVFLKTRPAEFFLRRAIRDTWGARFRGRLVFVFGSESPSDHQKSDAAGRMAALQLEARSNGDLLMLDFVDNYYNLSLKSLSILKWYDAHCARVQFVLQGDTDALMFPDNIMDFMSRRAVADAHATIYGQCWDGARVRREGKWAVTREQYIPLSYPRYCAGALLLMTGDVPGLLLKALEPTHPYFDIDDAFFTGILADTAGIARVHLKHGIYWHEELAGHYLAQSNCQCLRPLAVLEFKSGGAMSRAWRSYGHFFRSCNE